MRRIVALGAVGALAATSFLVTPSVDATTQARVEKSTISWGRCDDSFLRELGAQCSTLEVPVAYARPELGTLTLALSRLRHTAPRKDYKGVLLANPGGPGGSGLTLAPVLAVFAMPDDIRAALRLDRLRPARRGLQRAPAVLRPRLLRRPASRLRHRADALGRERAGLPGRRATPPTARPLEASCSITCAPPTTSAT